MILLSASTIYLYKSFYNLLIEIILLFYLFILIIFTKHYACHSTNWRSINIFPLLMELAVLRRQVLTQTHFNMAVIMYEMY